jgi:hypothetical protein
MPNCITYNLFYSIVRLYVMRNDVDATCSPSELVRVCRSCLLPSLPSNRKDINVSTALRHDADAHPLLSELERVCESCLVPSLPSNRKDTNINEYGDRVRSSDKGVNGCFVKCRLIIGF